MAFLSHRIKRVVDGYYPIDYHKSIQDILHLTSEQSEWILGELATKIVLQAKDEAELIEVGKLCQEAKLEVFLIKDAGLTATGEGMQGIQTYTALGIGPNRAEDIDKITGSEGIHPLKLY